MTDFFKLSQEQRAKGLIEDFPYNIQIAKALTFLGVDGYALGYGTTAQIELQYASDGDSPAKIVGDGSAFPNNTDLVNGVSPVFPIGNLGTAYQVSGRDQDIDSFPNDLDTVEGVLAVRRLLMKFFMMISQVGSTDPGSFLGLASPEFFGAGQAVDIGTAGSPGSLTLDAIDEAFFKVTDGPGRPNAIMSHSRALRAYLLLMYNKGLNPELIEQEWEDPLIGKRRGKIFSVHGVPWYVNDLCEVISPSGPESTPIFFMLLGDGETQARGRGIVGIVPRNRVGNMFVSRRTNIIGGSSEFRVDVSWPVGLAMGSKGSLSLLRYFTLPAA